MLLSQRGDHDALAVRGMKDSCEVGAGVWPNATELSWQQPRHSSSSDDSNGSAPQHAAEARCEREGSIIAPGTTAAEAEIVTAAECN